MPEQTLSFLARVAKPHWFLGIADQFVFSVGNFLSGVIIARAVSQSEFGLFALGMTIGLLLLDVQASLVSTPQAIRSAGMSGDGLKVFTGSTLVHNLGISLLSAIVLGAVVGAMAWLDVGPAGLTAVLAVIAAFSLFVLLREYWRRFFILRGQLVSVVVFDLGIVATQLAVLGFIAHLGVASAPLGHAAIGIACAAFAIPALFVLRDRFQLLKSAIWPDFLANLHYGAWFLLSGVAWSVGIYAYPWLLALLHGPETTGVWAACMGIIAIASIALVGVLNVLTPRIASAHATLGITGFRQYLYRTLFRYVLFSMFLAAVPLLFGEYLVTLVYGPAYTETHAVIAVLALNAVFGAASGCAGRGLMVIGKANLDFIVNLLTLILVFSIGWWATAAHGAIGAAIALSVANGLGALARVVIFDVAVRRLRLEEYGTRNQA